jgi:hypothetical protein
MGQVVVAQPMMRPTPLADPVVVQEEGMEESSDLRVPVEPQLELLEA